MARKRAGKPTMETLADGVIDLDTVAAALWRKPRRPQGRPEAQIALVCALLGAMGGRRGAQPDLRAIADRLGVGHQTLYRTLRVLEAKGVVVRVHRGLEIRL